MMAKQVAPRAKSTIASQKHENKTRCQPSRQTAITSSVALLEIVAVHLRRKISVF